MGVLIDVSTRSRADVVRRPSRRTAPVLLAGYLLAAFAVTARLWVDPAHRMVTGNPHDVDQFAWFLRWTPHALATGPGLFVTHAMNAPAGISLLWNSASILLPGLVFSPLTLLAGPMVVQNLLDVLGLGLSGWTAFLLLRRFVEPRAAALGGLLVGFSPALLHKAIGHPNLVLFMLVPVLLSLVVDAALALRPAWQTGLALGLAATAQLFTGEELLFDTALVAVLGLAVLAASRPRQALRRLPQLAATGGVALAVVVVLAGYPLWRQFFGPLRQHGSAFTPDFFKADLTGFVTPSDLLVFHTKASAAAAASFPGGAPEYLAYLGVPLLVLCALVAVARFGDLRVRVAAVVGTTMAVLSLGATLMVGGERTGIALPWSLVSSLPLVEADLPTRFGLFVPLCAAVLLAVAVEAVMRSGRRYRGALAGGLAAVCLLPLLPVPLPVTSVPPTPRFFTGPALAQLVPAASTALVLPFPTATQTAPIRWQTAAGMRFAMPGGYFTGPAADGHAYIGGPGLRPTAKVFDEVARTGARPAVDDVVRAQARADFRYWGVQTVLLGPSPHYRALHDLLVDLLGRPRFDVGGVQVWLRSPVP